MSWFTIRVVLHPEDKDRGADYTRLHGEMRKRGLFRVVRGESGETYWLPSATYLTKTHQNIDDVYDAADDAAGIVEPKLDNRTIFVTRCDLIQWHTLKPCDLKDYAFETSPLA